MTGILSRQKLTFANELIYELKVKNAMTKEVIYFGEDSTFREIQLSLKTNRISGVPILDDNMNIIGMVSIDNVISALDEGFINDKAKNHMTRNIITIPQNHSLVSAIKKFEKYRIGRLPVTKTSQSLKLAGILTMGDILNLLLLSIQSIAENIEQKESINTQLSDQLVIESCQKPLNFEVKRTDFDNAGKVASMVRKYLTKLNIDKQIIRRVAIICYEAEMNIIIHSLGGNISIEVGQDSIILIALDYGPGIPDVKRAMKPGFTTASEQIRALGFGAGMGLANIKRYADHFKLESSMKTGTILKAVINIGG